MGEPEDIARTALFLAIVVCGLIFYTKIFLLTFLSINVLSGPVLAAARALKKNARRKARAKEVPS